MGRDVEAPPCLRSPYVIPRVTGSEHFAFAIRERLCLSKMIAIYYGRLAAQALSTRCDIALHAFPRRSA